MDTMQDHPGTPAPTEAAQVAARVEEPTQVQVLPTQQIPAAEAPIEQAQPEDASLQDVASTMGSYARGRVARALATFEARTTRVLPAMFLGISAALFLVFFSLRMADMPQDSLFFHDAEDHLATPTYSGGAYGLDAPLVQDSLEVTDRHKELSSPSECLVNVVVTYHNDAVEALREAELTYVRRGGEWVCIAAEPAGAASYKATAGPVERKVLSSVTGILQKAESSLPEGAGSSTLPALYAGADASVTSMAFDEEGQTATAALHLARSSTFTSYECDVQATLAFRASNGQWELTDASASADAKEISLAPLVGTWQGSFLGQESTMAKCFGASNQGLRVTVESVKGERIFGTLDGLAHYHADSSDNADATEGDTLLEGVRFQGLLQDDAEGIRFVCSTPESAEGSVVLYLAFGAADDPTAASATLTTTHTYTATFLLIPYQRDATFSDTFVLTRE